MGDDTAPCSFPDCGRRTTRLGLCQTHDKQRRRGETLRPVQVRRGVNGPSLRDALGRKYCPSCREHKPESDFAVNRASQDGFQYYCRECRRRRYYEGRSEEIGRRRRLLNFRLSPADFEWMLVQQGNRCATCGSPNPTHVDHNHACCDGPKSCGECVRGVLCTRCNTALGMARDNPQTLAAMIEYLALYAIKTNGTPVGIGARGDDG